MAFGRSDLLRWIYLGRLTVVTGILVGALMRWFGAADEQTFLATVMFVTALAASAGSFWYTHVLGEEPGENFLYAQVVLDVILATGIIHITGGADSNFAPLYVLAIGEGALLLPLPGGMLIGGLASILYVADIYWFHPGVAGAPVAYQVVVFALVAFATGFIGDRLRRAGIAVDVVESELRQLRLDTGEILANIGTGVLTVDGSGRLAYLNPAGATLLGLDSEQWLGAPVLRVVDEVAPGMGTLLRRSTEANLPISRFKTVATLDGRSVVLGVSTAVLPRADGGPPSATAIFQDITDLERVEALNRRTERLEAVTELSASLAHEIKNPLASIRSAVEQLVRDRLGGEDRDVLERLVLNESDRLSRLLSEFLDFSGLRMGRQERVDLAGVIRDCVGLARQLPEADSELEIRCTGHEDPLWVTGDPDLLHRAILNLLLNAIHFAGPGGTVELTLDRLGAPVPLEAEEMRRPVRISVRDSGPGVPAEDQERIFDPFFTTRKGGSGLGLAVVHRAVQSHEGSVQVRDADGGGAEFLVYLPGERTGTEESA